MEKIDVPTPSSLETSNSSPSAQSIEEVLKNAQAGLAAITALSETAKATATAADETQKLTAAALNEAKTKLEEITTAATQVVAAKTKIADDQAVIATKSEHIQKAQEHADKVRADLDRALTSATQQATEVEGLKSRAQTAVDNAVALLSDIRTTKGSVETDVATIATARKTAEESAAQSKGLADKSASVEARIAVYEKRLAELDVQCAQQLKEIVDALPGATAAGLATSWDKRRQTFLNPHNRWQKVFVGSVLAIVVVAASGLVQVYLTGKTPEYDELIRLWLARLPIAGALVWLALHASHESALAKRLEEEYGYKAAVASCLMGFQKQMSDVGKDAVSNPSLAKLLEDTLATMAAPPGRIYDKHALAVSPSSEMADVAKAVAKITGPTNP